jgi:hypothetical protein
MPLQGVTETMTAGSLRISSLLVATLAAGCQTGATVKMSFENRSARGQALTLSSGGQTPTVFGIRMVVAYLAEDQDADMNNVGNVGRIWVNPVCDPELRHCGIGAGAGANRVTDYFDLALPSDEVNARLNAQGLTVEPGTYRLLRLDLAGPQGAQDRDVPNMRYGMAGGAPSEVRRDNVYVVKLDPPLVLESGDTVTMSLGYDIRDSYFGDPALDEGHPPEGTTHQNWYCGDRASNPARGPCLQFAGFSPAVTRSASP